MSTFRQQTMFRDSLICVICGHLWIKFYLFCLLVSAEKVSIFRRFILVKICLKKPNFPRKTASHATKNHHFSHIFTNFDAWRADFTTFSHLF